LQCLQLVAELMLELHAHRGACSCEPSPSGHLVMRAAKAVEGHTAKAGDNSALEVVAAQAYGAELH
jgi:hypothetical protein